MVPFILPRFRMKLVMLNTVGTTKYGIKLLGIKLLGTKKMFII